MEIEMKTLLNILAATCLFGATYLFVASWINPLFDCLILRLATKAVYIRVTPLCILLALIVCAILATRDMVFVDVNASPTRIHLIKKPDGQWEKIDGDASPTRIYLKKEPEGKWGKTNGPSERTGDG